MSIVDSLSSKIKSVQTKIGHFANGRTPAIEDVVEETLGIKHENKKSTTFEIIDADYWINSKGTNNYSNCQTIFRNFHKIEEGTYVDSSPYSRAGLDYGIL